jgi:hypothetical protein
VVADEGFPPADGEEWEPEAVGDREARALIDHEHELAGDGAAAGRCPGAGAPAVGVVNPNWGSVAESNPYGRLSLSSKKIDAPKSKSPTPGILASLIRSAMGDMLPGRSE